MSLLERIRRIEQGQQRETPQPSKPKSSPASPENDEIQEPERIEGPQRNSTRRDFARELRLFAEQTEQQPSRTLVTNEKEATFPLRPPASEETATNEKYMADPVVNTEYSPEIPVAPEPIEPAVPTVDPPDADTLAELRLKIHARLIEKLPPQLLEGDYADEQAQQEVRRIVRRLLDEETLVMTDEQREYLFAEVMDEVYGLGPIEELMRDSEITEIMVNGPQQIFVERHGLIESTNRRFQDDAHLLRVIQRIVAPINRRLDESNPMVDGRLPDGSRVNAVLPPVSLTGPILTVHKFYKENFTAEDLLTMGSISEGIIEFLMACVTSRQDILISGGTSTGKTTMLNMLSSFIPRSERLITIEDAAELRLNQDHVITLESRPSGVAGRGEVSIRDIVRNALRMRPDRIIIGEVRGGESLDMLQAMNTGHEGSMCTVHANSPLDMLSRLETMVMMAGLELPERTIREQIVSAIDIIVHMGRLPDGSRKVMKISEVCGMDQEQIVLQDIFVYRRRGNNEHGQVVGDFEATGVKPSFWDTHYLS